MLRNYFKIALRNLRKSRFYAFINISGLSLGMAAALLIGLWVWDELTYNRYYKNYPELVQVLHNQTHGNEVSTRSSNPYPLAAAMRTGFAGDFKYVALCTNANTRLFGIGDKVLSEQGVFAEADFPEMLGIDMLEGGRKALTDPSSVLISESMAKALFGNETALNKAIRLDNKDNVKVGGVYKDMPFNTTFNNIMYIMPFQWMQTHDENYAHAETEWNSNSLQLFVQLQPGRNVALIAEKVKHLLEGHERKDKPVVLLFPMDKWHLYGDFKSGINTGGAITFVWLFGIVGVFILLLACINFMNLSTARSEKRAKEVGIRKAVGSVRSQLIIQFLSESLLLSLLAMVAAVLLAWLALPWFNDLSGKQVQLPFEEPLFWLLLLAFTCFTGFIAGSYPAFFLSSFNPVKVLKGTFRQSRLGSLPRKVLVVLQFTVSVSLIISTLIVYQQITYARNRPIGYSREGLISVNINDPALNGHYEGLRSELINSGAALNMSESSNPTTGIWAHQSGFNWTGKDPSLNASFGVISVTHDFGSTIGWQFADGRDFSRSFPSDSAGFVLNEAAVKFIGYTNPVGKTIEYLYSDRQDKNYRIVGVVKNMVMESPFDESKPVIFMLNYDWVNVITIKLNTAGGVQRALDKTAAVFKKYSPSVPFKYTFVDDDYAAKFRAEVRVGKLATFFASFAVFISCLGLFGLAAFTAEQRTKEIGVRKVLGASVAGVWRLLSKDFLVLVTLSFVIAVPLSYYLMHQWLQQYDYRASISVWIIVGTMTGILLLTLATVSAQAIKAALANPVKSLRTE